MTVTATSTPFSHISIKPLHPTFGAEISGVDFASPVADEVFQEIYQAVTQYGVVVFRSTGLTDEGHIAFSRKFGELDDVKPYIAAGRKHRLNYPELFDVSNVEADGSILSPESSRGQANKGNDLFHVDSSFNPRRAGYSLLLAHELPPAGMGGHTAFADTRTAFDTLSPDLKAQLLKHDYIACHSMHHSRKLAAPEAFADLNPLDYPMGRHRLVQRHEASNRMNLYIAAHVHHIEGLAADESRTLFDQLFRHATREDNTVDVEWQAPGDLAPESIPSIPEKLNGHSGWENWAFFVTGALKVAIMENLIQKEIPRPTPGANDYDNWKRQSMAVSHWLTLQLGKPVMESYRSLSVVPTYADDAFQAIKNLVLGRGGLDTFPFEGWKQASRMKRDHFRSIEDYVNAFQTLEELEEELPGWAADEEKRLALDIASSLAEKAFSDACMRAIEQGIAWR
ncbi:hypothetical protein FE257_004605 [Aspergillus nanangensis]|uniref:TauD/TfdA-like domain-containing protein n=1 Tax=Aspergillus nanangensis TaxID=2582783 RepID=A0AAD4CYT4_ASPNN|nr:hypothetical protein FE257_004605 [Aspergillus nanangensis]